MAASLAARPVLSRDLTGAELRRWYWLHDELVAFARAQGVRTSGGKRVLTSRLAATLDGVPFDEPTPRHVAVAPALPEPLTPATVLPRGQRCTQQVRAWFADHVGPAFRFDAAMREHIAASDGSGTLQDALEFHRAARRNDPDPLGEQFEYNRFTRAWWQAHPGGARQELLAAWHDHRRRPVDGRGAEATR